MKSITLRQIVINTSIKQWTRDQNLKGLVFVVWHNIFSYTAEKYTYLYHKKKETTMFRYLNMLMVLGLFLLTVGCDQESSVTGYPDVDREDKIPADISKRGPETDLHPPILHSGAYHQPVPLPYPLNTAGAEDSPFILPDGRTLYFFFTPDVRVPPEKQIIDEVTGIWRSQKTGDVWGKPQRVWLQKQGKLALDGAVCIQGEEMWFASAREGYTGVNMFTAACVNGSWSNWRYAGDRLMKEIQIGEVHLHGDELYFHSTRPGGKGGYDI
jgi:hypothetical protein